MFSASLMNYHDHSMSSVNFFKGAEMIMCADSKNISKDPVPVYPVCQTKDATPCTNSEISTSDADQESSSGKNYNASVVVM